MTLFRDLSAATMAAACLTWVGAMAAPSLAAADDNGRVGQVCADVVGVPPGGTHYAACVQSLTNSLRDLQRTQGLRQARAACEARGLQPNTGALAACELDTASDGAAPTPADVHQRPGGGASYFAVSPTVSWRRGQLACAALGFDPIGSAFPACAANLQAALSRQSTP